jgi:hypothetical protein
MPLRIIAQPKKIVTPMPDTDGMRIAKRPAMINRMLRAMDQLRDLGARGESDVEEALMRILLQKM